MSVNSPGDGGNSDAAAPPAPDADVIARLDFQRKILEKILNAALVSSNVAREVRAESDTTGAALKAILTDLGQASERREQKTQAIFDAFQRSFRDEIITLRNGISSVLREQAFLSMAGAWLSVLDDVDALARASGSSGAPAWAEALQALGARIVSILTANGLEPLPVTVGETPFDPELHEAVGPTTQGEVEASQAAAPGTVVAVHARGFLHGGRCYRCARVVASPGKPKQQP